MVRHVHGCCQQLAARAAQRANFSLRPTTIFWYGYCSARQPSISCVSTLLSISCGGVGSLIVTKPGGVNPLISISRHKTAGETVATPVRQSREGGRRTRKRRQRARVHTALRTVLFFTTPFATKNTRHIIVSHQGRRVVHSNKSNHHHAKYKRQKPQGEKPFLLVDIVVVRRQGRGGKGSAVWFTANYGRQRG